MPTDNIQAAVQAAALACDYTLAITLVREHGLMDRCLACVGPVAASGMRWTLGDLGELLTCGTCTEQFARWLVGKSPERGRLDLAWTATTMDFEIVGRHHAA